MVKNLKAEKTTFRGKSASDRPTYGQEYPRTDKINYRDSLAVLKQYIQYSYVLHISLGVRWMRAKEMKR